VGWTLLVSQSLATMGHTNSLASSAGTNAPAAAAVATNALPRMVDFGCGDKCLPCKMMLPILKDLQRTQAGKLDVVSVDVWENPKEKAKFRIGVLPTQVFFAADGKEIYRHVGFFPRDDILKKWKELGVDLGPAESGSPSKAQ